MKKKILVILSLITITAATQIKTISPKDFTLEFDQPHSKPDIFKLFVNGILKTNYNTNTFILVQTNYTYRIKVAALDLGTNVLCVSALFSNVESELSTPLTIIVK